MRKSKPIKIRPLGKINIRRWDKNIERQFKVAREIVLREDRKLLEELAKY